MLVEGPDRLWHNTLTEDWKDNHPCTSFFCDFVWPFFSCFFFFFTTGLVGYYLWFYNVIGMGIFFPRSLCPSYYGYVSKGASRSKPLIFFFTSPFDEVYWWCLHWHVHHKSVMYACLLKELHVEGVSYFPLTIKT